MGRAALNGSPNMEDIRISKTRIRVAQNKTVYQTLLKLQNWQQYHIISTKFKQFIICLRLWDRRRYFCRYDWRVLCQRTLSLAKSYLVYWYCSQLKGRYAELISPGMKSRYPWVWRVDVHGYEEVRKWRNNGEAREDIARWGGAAKEAASGRAHCSSAPFNIILAANFTIQTEVWGALNWLDYLRVDRLQYFCGLIQVKVRLGQVWLALRHKSHPWCHHSWPEVFFTYPAEWGLWVWPSPNLVTFYAAVVGW